MISLWKHTLLVFFSSRRRHTRWTGDWSSDVCSSDLSLFASVASPTTSREALKRAGDVVGEATLANNEGEVLSDQGRLEERSEERRVGKKGSGGNSSAAV